MDEEHWFLLCLLEWSKAKEKKKNFKSDDNHSKCILNFDLVFLKPLLVF